MNLKVLLICTFFGLLISFCKKKEASDIKSSTTLPRPVKNIFVSSTVKEWGYFKVGSYWIIKDSVSVQPAGMDSVYVTSVNTHTVLYQMNDTDVVAEEITINFSSTVFFPFFVLNSYGSISTNEFTRDFMIFQMDTTHLAAKDGITQNYSVSALSISGNKYTNVRIADFSYLVAQPSNQPVFINGGTYWAKNIGPIKSEGITLPFEVVRYKVFQ